MFFFDTPIGKSTKHIMDAFDLKSIGVTRMRNNFFITVAPAGKI